MIHVKREQRTCGTQRETRSLLDGRYRVLSVVGRGSSGTTFQCERLSDGEQFAVKEIHVASLDSLKALELIEREAAVLAQLDHPGIPRFVESFSTDTDFYLVSQYTAGQTLVQESKNRRYDLLDVLAIMADVLEIAAYLHSRTPAVVHRDIKPSNVLRRESDGRLILIDFGMVRDHEPDSQVGGSTIAGTYGYMAPEQYIGKADQSSDIYAVAVMGLSLLTRRPPHELFDVHHHPCWARLARLPRRLKLVFNVLLCPEPRRRARDTEALVGVLRRFAEVDSPTRVELRSALAPFSPAGRWSKSFVLLVCVLLLVLSASSLALALHREEGERLMPERLERNDTVENITEVAWVNSEDVRSLCEQSGTCRPISEGLPGFDVTVECTRARENAATMIDISESPHVAGLATHCYVRINPQQGCELYCQVGAKPDQMQLHATPLTSEEFRRRHEMVAAYLKDTFGKEQMYMEHDMGPNILKIWDWMADGTNLRLEAMQYKNVDPRVLDYFPEGGYKLVISHKPQ